MKKPIWAVNLRNARKQQELSQKEVAEQIFKSRQTYQLYESGKHEPSIDTWKLIWDIFRVTDPLKFWNEEYFREAA